MHSLAGGFGASRLTGRKAAGGSRTRRAFSLVEAILMLALAVLVTAILWQVFLAGSKQAHQTDMRLTAIQGAQLLVERIRQDMFTALFAPNDTVPLVGPAPGGDAMALNLLVYDGYRFLERPDALYSPQDNDPSWIEAARVSYVFDPLTHFVTRRAPGHDERLSFAKFLSVTFRPIAGPSPTPGAPGVSGVRLMMLCATEEVLAHPDRAHGQEIAIPAALPFPAQSSYVGSASWMDAWFHQSPRVKSPGVPAAVGQPQPSGS